MKFPPVITLMYSACNANTVVFIYFSWNYSKAIIKVSHLRASPKHYADSSIKGRSSKILRGHGPLTPNFKRIITLVFPQNLSQDISKWSYLDLLINLCITILLRSNSCNLSWNLSKNSGERERKCSGSWMRYNL